MYRKFTKRVVKTAYASFDSIGSSFESLGTKIRKALLYGVDIGSSVPVDFDEDNDDETLDILASPNHDFFDIAEATGKMVESSNVPNDIQKE